MDISACPYDSYLISLGEDGRLYVYAYLRKTLIFEHQFPAHGTCLIWLPHQISKHCDEIILGFDDGCLRVCVLNINDQASRLFLTQTVKAHDKAITKIVVNARNNVLVSGSDDSTIFFFQIELNEFVRLVPIGYLQVPNPVTCLTWHLNVSHKMN